MSEKKAVVLAGGRGTRLRPYTVVLPKPLMPIGDYPILEVIIRQLVQQGFPHITLAINHQAELFKTFFAHGERWNASIDFSLETKALGTMGPLKLIPDLPEHFLVMNGDILTDLSYSGLMENHIRSGAVLTISSHKRVQEIDYGVLEIGSDRLLEGFREKPKIPFEVSMGVYVLSRRALDFIPDDRLYGFDHLVLDLLAAGEKINVAEHEGYWLDIGRPDDYARAIDEFDSMQSRFIHE
jgi:NDP-sugar pyrophosphorylase family protein